LGTAPITVHKDSSQQHASFGKAAFTGRIRPLAEAFERWLRGKLALISQKGKLADAIRYALSRWES
jgi:transposase